MKEISEGSICVVSLGTSSHCALQYFSWFTREWKIFQKIPTALADWKTEHFEMIRAKINIPLNLAELEEVSIKKDINSEVLKRFEGKFHTILNGFENLIVIAALGGRTGTACLNILSKIIEKSKVKSFIAIVFLPLEKEERKRKLALTLLKNINKLNNIFIIDLEQVRKLFKFDIMDTFSTSDLLAAFSIINIIYLLKHHKENVLLSNSAFFKKGGTGTFSIFDGEIESPITKEDYKILMNWLSKKLLYKPPKHKKLFKLWLLPAENTKRKNGRKSPILKFIDENSSDQIIFYNFKNKAVLPALFIKAL